MIRISTNSTSIFNNGTETDFEYISWSDERVQDLDVEDLDLVEFRMCDCPRPVYQPNTLCPLESTICGVPVDVAFPVLCFQDETSVMLVRNVSYEKSSRRDPQERTYTHPALSTNL